MRSQCRFMGGNKCTTLVQDVYSSGVVRVWGQGHIQELSILPAQFCCEPKLL